MNDYTPQAGDLIEATNRRTGERERAFVFISALDGSLRVHYERGGQYLARDAIDPVLLDRALTPWPTTPGSTARLTVGERCDRWAVLTSFCVNPARTYWVSREHGALTEAEMRAAGWVPVHDAGTDQ